MSEVASSEQENSVLSPPSGFKLRYTLEGHSDIITQIAWSADGKKLASASKDRISLIDIEQAEQITEIQASTLAEMDKTANLQRNRETATSSLQGKIATKDFDVFLCHNSDDKPEVKRIGEKLKELGILPWLDEWELQPGLPWQRALEEQIRNIKAAAVFIGKNNTGPWQDAELDAFLRQFVRRRCPVIPVLLPDCVQTPELPIFLEGMMWVDFRQLEPDPMKQLIWGITGERKSEILAR